MFAYLTNQVFSGYAEMDSLGWGCTVLVTIAVINSKLRVKLTFLMLSE